MKKITLTTAVIIIAANLAFGQGTAINNSGTAADNSAMLDVSSTSKGMLIPRVALQSTTDATTIIAPAISLMVYNTNASMTGGDVGYWYWDGNMWKQLTAGTTGTCPSGTTDAGSYCIEQNERSAATWFNANVTCGNINGRLCSWGEWYYACQKSSLGLTNMTNNFEWIDNAVACQSNTHTQYNYPNDAAKRVGRLGCTANENEAVSTATAFRCCFNK